MTRAGGLAVGLGLLLACAAHAAPGWPQARPGPAPDPLDQVRDSATHPVPALPPAPPPGERLVPERRVIVPGTGKEVVIPPHYERPITDQQSQVPPLTGYGTKGEGPVHIPGGDRPPADVRPGP